MAHNHIWELEILLDRWSTLGPGDLKSHVFQLTCQCGMCLGPTPNNCVSGNKAYVLKHSASPCLSVPPRLQDKGLSEIFFLRVHVPSSNISKQCCYYQPLSGWTICSVKGKFLLFPLLAYNRWSVHICWMKESKEIQTAIFPQNFPPGKRSPNR